MSTANPPQTPELSASSATRSRVLRKLLRDPQAVITTLVLLTYVVLGLLAPVITQHGPNEASLALVNTPPGVDGYPLGGDSSGRDIYARLIYSINTSLISGLLGTAVALTIGVTAGLIGGYFGKRIAVTTEWIFNLIMTFPGLLLIIVLLPVTKGDFRATVLIFGVFMSPTVFRIVRNLVVGVKHELFVDAARVSGLSNLRILGRHVLSAVRGPVIIAAAFMAGTMIGIQSGLAFLGIGSPLVPSFGAMIADGFLQVYRDPTLFLWPALALGILTASLVLLGNSLRDALQGTRPRPVKIRPARAVSMPERTVPAAASTAATSSAGEAHLLEVSGLAIAYPSADGELREVVSDVSLTLSAGEVLGLVGESGSGKTQTAFSILGVLPPEALITRGSIRLDGREILGLSENELRGLRGTQIAYIPQEPMSNLDPAFTVGSQLVEALRVSTGMAKGVAKARVLAMLDRVGIHDPERVFRSYPHQISGGMAQRVLIAGATVTSPKLLIADEPTTALDVTVQAEILDLLRDLQQELGMAVLLVTHSFGVVADICDRIAVMQSGRIVETGSALDVFDRPQHDYTKSLLGSILDESVVRGDLATAKGTS